MWGLELDPAQDALGDLLCYSLVEWDGAAQRYRLHDLARDLAQTRDRAGIAEIAANLRHPDSNVQSDCIKVLYETGYLAPELIADYVDDFLALLGSKNNRLVWGSMIALVIQFSPKGAPAMDKLGYRFSFGPWNIHEGADPFGPAVRPSRSFEDKLAVFKELGFDAVQFHDDDAVPWLDELSAAEICARARHMRALLDDNGLTAEFVAPRLWESPLTIDGAYTANDPGVRQYAIERSKKAADIAAELGTDLMVLWLAREGTYLREAKSAARATHHLLEAIDTLLAYSPNLRIAIEPKPNEPMDLAYIPTIGHALALGSQSSDSARVGCLVESAHAILAGLDPSDEMSFALAFDKLWSVHLNDQNGLKFDQDRAFGAVDLRRAFNQVRVLDEHRFFETGVVGMDVKAIRTQPAELATRHLQNSLQLFLRLVALARSLDGAVVQDLVARRDYEALDWVILNHLMGCA